MIDPITHAQDQVERGRLRHEALLAEADHDDGRAVQKRGAECHLQRVELAVLEADAEERVQRVTHFVRAFSNLSPCAAWTRPIVCDCAKRTPVALPRPL
jgi:hypothetical protein